MKEVAPKMWVGPRLSTERRLALTRALNVISWIAAGLVILLRIFEVIPSTWSWASVLFAGAGVAASVTLSRMSLARTITDAFAAGLRVAHAPRSDRECVLKVNYDGIIQQVENPEVIHWDKGELDGQDIEVIVARRLRTAHQRSWEKFRKTRDVSGVVVNIPILGHHGNEYAMEAVVDCLPDHVIVTMRPTLAPVGNTDLVLTEVKRKILAREEGT